MSDADMESCLWQCILHATQTSNRDQKNAAKLVARHAELEAKKRIDIWADKPGTMLATPKIALTPLKKQKAAHPNPGSNTPAL